MELADVLDSKSSPGDRVRVRPPLPAPIPIGGFMAPYWYWCSFLRSEPSERIASACFARRTIGFAQSMLQTAVKTKNTRGEYDMELQEVIAQGLSIIAMFFNCISYLQKKKSTLLTCQLIGSILFGINYLLLGAMSGALLNVIAMIRAIVFLRKDKLHADNAIWTAAFIASYLGSYALVFTVFGKEPTARNLIIELLPVLAMTALNISYRYAETKMVRRYGLISSPMWLIYNIASFSIGAMICESINLVSITVGIIRYDLKKK